jgi:type II secretory pathway pseudopilin PulG
VSDRGTSLGCQRRPAGYALVEVSLVLLLVSLLTTSALAVLSSQRRFYAAQLQIAAARDVARVALTVLSVELRAASPVAGDLYAIAADSVALRSYTGFGVVCSVSGNEINLRRIAGTFQGSPNDSLLVYRGPRVTSWGRAAVVGARSAAGGHCPDGGRPDLVLRAAGAIGDVVAGAPLRGFRPYVYRLYRGGNGRWWLGQKLRGGRFQPVAGPFADPAAGGLRLDFLDAVGDPTTEARAAVRVRVSLVAQSARPVPARAGPHFSHDSLSTVVLLRNSCGDGARLEGCTALP